MTPRSAPRDPAGWDPSTQQGHQQHPWGVTGGRLALPAPCASQGCPECHFVGQTGGGHIEGPPKPTQPFPEAVSVGQGARPCPCPHPPAHPWSRIGPAGPKGTEGGTWGGHGGGHVPSSPSHRGHGRCLTPPSLPPPHPRVGGWIGGPLCNPPQLPSWFGGGKLRHGRKQSSPKVTPCRWHSPVGIAPPPALMGGWAPSPKPLHKVGALPPLCPMPGGLEGGSGCPSPPPALGDVDDGGQAGRGGRGGSLSSGGAWGTPSEGDKGGLGSDKTPPAVLF